MNDMNRFHLSSTVFRGRVLAPVMMVVVAALMVLARPAEAQMRDADPEASNALRTVIETMRASPIEVREQVVISTVEGERRADAGEVGFEGGRGVRVERGEGEVPLDDRAAGLLLLRGLEPRWYGAALL